MTAIEHSMVQFGRTSIPYAIERGRRHKTVAITVDPEHGVRVRAPRYTPIIKLDDMSLRMNSCICFMPITRASFGRCSGG